MSNANTVAGTEKTAFWQGTNFWVGVLMLILVPFGISQGVAEQVVQFGFGAVALVFAVRTALTSAHFQGWASIFKNANWWNYLTGVIVAISPNIGSLVPALQDLADAISLKNYGKIISAILTLGTMIYYLITKK